MATQKVAPAPKRYKFKESVSVGQVGRIDRETCTIHDVRVCGVQSANGRKYSPTALKNAIPLYEGVRVFFNHPEGEENSRAWEERFGRLVNVREAQDGGLVGDLKYNPKHPNAESFLWLAENDPDGMGLSHNAEGLGSIDGNGDVLVEKIVKVHSVDLVDGPATTFSLYEQKDYNMIEEETPNADPVVTEPAEVETEAGTMGIDAMLAELVEEIAKHPEWSKADKIAKIKDVINMMEDGVADQEMTEAEDDKQKEDMAEQEDEKEEEKMVEQLSKFKCKAAKFAVKKLVRESRRKLAVNKGLKADLVTSVFLEQLTSVSADKALKLIEDRKQVATKAGAQTPKSFAPNFKTQTAAELAASLNWNE